MRISPDPKNQGIAPTGVPVQRNSSPYGSDGKVSWH